LPGLPEQRADGHQASTDDEAETDEIVRSQCWQHRKSDNRGENQVEGSADFRLPTICLDTGSQFDVPETG